MRELPRGTVTFLFTDIEGSTKLLHELGDKYAEALAAHRRVLRDAFARHRGVEVDTEGDAFFAVFERAADALAAAEQAQRALSLPVRMGIHTGEPQLTPEGYVGMDVHRAARICSAAHGGQVVVSAAARSMLDGADLRELGEHRLKDFDDPVALFQLGSARFPPLRTISNTNLPKPVSPFVGRAEEVAAVARLLLDGARLLTLTGAGGSGKTRLAIEAATELVPEFKAGVFWVGLAPLRDPDLVLDTIGQTLGAKDSLAEHVADRELLLLLDNLEQVIASAAALSKLLESCPNLRLLVTSRELLRVKGELEFPVPPLAEQEAVELFCRRAQIEPDQEVEQLCAALDNLPLAVELAASRVHVLSPAQIRERLGQRLDLFQGGRDAEARQQTLRATMEWSHDLLDDEEQRLFARLAVFAGGCTLAAAEAVADARLDPLQSLVDKSLVRFASERFWMLETIREYAAEQLDRTGDASVFGERHARFFLELAEEPDEPLVQWEALERWFPRANAEYENLRAALAWADASARADLLSRFAVALWWLWVRRGAVAEARRWIDIAAASSDALDPLTRARVIDTVGSVAITQGESAYARECFLRSLAAYRELGDKRREARMLLLLSNLAVDDKRYAEATRLLEVAGPIFREVGHTGGFAAVTNSLAMIAHQEKQYGRAEALYEQALQLYGGNDGARFAPLLNLGELSLDRGDVRGAANRARAVLENAARTGYPWYVAYAVGLTGRVVAAQGSSDAAARLLAASETLLEDTGVARQAAEQEAHERVRLQIAERLGDEEFAEASRVGSELSPEAAIAYALGALD
jgi:predicted ATPase